ncbi:hypothetical protein [Conexibacter sp. S30A1]|uniref:hypothetical protein n=1 Tax=Conexibacter sp. S30A1 TaxID=2937800 RepID=UPI0020103B0A|nr:hypothetical protein [Conexibacter sp. S30A1]
MEGISDPGRTGKRRHQHGDKQHHRWRQGSGQHPQIADDYRDPAGHHHDPGVDRDQHPITSPRSTTFEGPTVTIQRVAQQLNARAQAIRKQHRQLGEHGLEIPGRPYELHEGDEIQVRHTINHPGHGPVRNGTNATVTAVDAERHEVELRLADGARVKLDHQQVEQADLRLAYVQHPFPAQGHTTDTTHVIITTQATREGTYVAITRARAQTHIYHAPDIDQTTPAVDPLARLAERVGQTEPEVPSINTPLAHETTVRAIAELEADGQRVVPGRRNEIEYEPDRTPPRHARSQTLPPIRRDREPERDPAVLDHDPQENNSEHGGVARDSGGPAPAPSINIGHDDRRKGDTRRVWPGRAVIEPDGPEREPELRTRDRTSGHEL